MDYILTHVSNSTLLDHWIYYEMKTKVIVKFLVCIIYFIYLLITLEYE